MKFFQEITEWEVPAVNHIYLLNDSKEKMYAYIKAGTDAVFTFKRPIRISTKGRKFKAVENTFNYTMPKDEIVADVGARWEVKGSKGDTYIVQKVDNQYNCTCSGFRFRGSCKHVTEIKGN